MGQRYINVDKIENKRIEKNEILDKIKRKESQRKLGSSYKSYIKFN